MASDLVIALDVDGVLVHDGKGEHWLNVVALELGMTPEDFHPFFQAHWATVVTGQRSVEDALADYFPDLDAEFLLRRWFEESSEVNEEVVAAAKQWQANGARLVLATNQEHRRAAHLRAHLGAHLEIEDVCYSARFGVGKPDARFFAAVDKCVANAPVVFIDDAIANVESARAHGWHGVHYPAQTDWREQVDAYFK